MRDVYVFSDKHLNCGSDLKPQAASAPSRQPSRHNPSPCLGNNLLCVQNQGLGYQSKRNDGVHRLTLKDNQLDSVRTVQAAARIFPYLKGLDLSNNQLQDIEALAPWKKEFRLLEELFLQNNPLNQQSNLVSTMREWFQSLRCSMALRLTAVCLLQPSVRQPR